MRGPYIAGPFYDAVMFIGALLLALAISGTPLADEELELVDETVVHFSGRGLKAGFFRAGSGGP